LKFEVLTGEAVENVARAAAADRKYRSLPMAEGI
jgi:hypothetical protein